MRRILVLMMGIALFFGCGDGEPQTEDQTLDQGRLFTFQGTPNVINLKANAITLIKNWKEFSELERGFDVMFQATANEDLVLAIDDLLEREKVLGESEYPEEFNTMKIRSRQKVLRTFMLKVKAGLAYNRDVTEGLKQMLTAYNALREQMNTITNNQFNTEFILNEAEPKSN